MLSDEQGSSPPITGKAKGLANLRPPWKKGQSGNPAGKPKDLARLGDLFAQELFKVVPANIGGKIVKRSQAEILVAQMVKQAITKGGTATRIALQFMEEHEARQMRREELKLKKQAEGSEEIDWTAEREELYQRLLSSTEYLQLPAPDEEPNG